MSQHQASLQFGWIAGTGNEILLAHGLFLLTFLCRFMGRLLTWKCESRRRAPASICCFSLWCICAPKEGRGRRPSSFLISFLRQPRSFLLEAFRSSTSRRSGVVANNLAFFFGYREKCSACLRLCPSFLVCRVM